MSKKFIACNALGAALLIGGAVLLVAIMRSRAVNIISTPNKPSTSVVSATAIPTQSLTPETQPAGYIAGNPTSISIPSLNINLAVTPGYYDTESQQWTLTTNKVQFATITAQPNNLSGNTFMYGHARTNIFGSLPKIKAGAQAVVTTSNGHTFYYTLSSTRIVNPADSDSVFNYQGKPILTLQTCVGLLYQSRELLTFNLDRVV
jgi:LPXTG-site transpeptidase (sortase) family protein